MPRSNPSRLTIRSEDKSLIEGLGMMQLLNFQPHRDQEDTLHGESAGPRPHPHDLPRS